MNGTVKTSWTQPKPGDIPTRLAGRCFDLCYATCSPGTQTLMVGRLRDAWGNYPLIVSDRAGMHVIYAINLGLNIQKYVDVRTQHGDRFLISLPMTLAGEHARLVELLADAWPGARGPEQAEIGGGFLRYDATGRHVMADGRSGQYGKGPHREVEWELNHILDDPRVWTPIETILRAERECRQWQRLAETDRD